MNVLIPIDQLAIFEKRIRTDGVWCDTSAHDKIAHKMVCKHPAASIAISLCGMIIKPFDKLHENWSSQRCLVCSLYEGAGKETISKVIPKLNDAIDKHETISDTDKDIGQ